MIFKPLAQLSLPIHLCLGSVPCTSSQTKEALHQQSGKTDRQMYSFERKTLSSACLIRASPGSMSEIGASDSVSDERSVSYNCCYT